MATIASLVGEPQSASDQVQIEGPTPRGAPVLFLDTAQTGSEISQLLALLNDAGADSVRPEWIGIPASADSNRKSASQPAPVGGARPAGAVRVVDSNNKTASFDLYALPVKNRSTRSIEPVKAKIPEPEENLPARERWFQRRSGGH